MVCDVTCPLHMAVLIVLVCIFKRGCIVPSVRGVVRFVQRLNVVGIGRFQRHTARCEAGSRSNVAKKAYFGSLADVKSAVQQSRREECRKVADRLQSRSPQISLRAEYFR